MLLSRLVGGCILVSAASKMDDVIKRLLSPDARHKRVVLLDNIKTRKLSWSELESLITIDNISGHRMYKGEGSRPNSLIWVMTMNGGSLSKDMAKRTVVIKLKRPEKFTPDWLAKVTAFIGEHRWRVAADAIAELKRAVPRWGNTPAGAPGRPRSSPTAKTPGHART
jgi:hypothetical protein